MGALIVGIKAYDKLIAEGTAEQDKIVKLEESFKTAILLLKKVGMFDVFPPEDWVRGISTGRRRVGELYFELIRA